MTLQSLIVLALALCALAAPPRALAQGPIQAPPAAARLRLGPLRLTALQDSGFVTPNDGGDFGSNVGPQAVADVLAAAGASKNQITLGIDALAVRMPGHVVLIDTGLGPAFHGALLASLGLAGIAPDTVSDVLITHTHLDHVGGLLTAEGRSAFPRAAIWLSRKEWAWMKSRPGAHRMVATIAPQVKTFEPGAPILPGITPRALYGHTPGHVGYEIVSQGEALEDIGDTAHSSIVSLAEPGWTGWIDEDPKAAAATRLAELKRLAANHELIFAPHFPFPGVGWIVAQGAGYAWKPDPALRRIGTATHAGPR